jgi:futalosine hydrolase
MRILIVCAVQAELAALPFSAECATLICGVGPVEAGIALARRLARETYDLVVNVGVAGGFAPLVDIGSAVVVSEEHYVELGREDGVPLALPDGIELQTHIAPASSFQLKLANCDAACGPAVTSACITTSDERAAALRSRFPGVLCESMEGFALARAAAQAAVPFVELRGISNRVGNRAVSGWNFEAGLRAAARLTQVALVRLRQEAA